MRALFQELRARIHEDLDEPMTTEDKLAEIRRRMKAVRAPEDGTAPSEEARSGE